MTCHPVRLKRVDFVGSRPFKLHGLEPLGQRFDLLIDTQDVLVIAHIDCTAEKLAAFRVGASNEQSLSSHEVPLISGRHEAVDVLSCGHQDLSSKVAALLAPVQLVLEVDRRSTVFRK